MKLRLRTIETPHLLREVPPERIPTGHEVREETQGRTMSPRPRNATLKERHRTLEVYLPYEAKTWQSKRIMISSAKSSKRTS